MEFQKLTSPSLRELFVRQLVDMILSGNLAVGEQLPPERELAETMQVSRAVVNGGIAELARKGFLLVKPRVGAFVADYRYNGTIETFTAIMNYNGGRFRDAEIRSILELRVALDILAVQLQIPRVTDAEVEVLREKTEGIRAAKSDAEAAECAFAFQHELAIQSENTLLPLIFSSFKVPVHTLWLRFCALYGAGALYENTYTLWDRIRARDIDGAVAWINRSVEDSISGDRSIYY
ncbi:MAG: GntR family transcriptional regulator [Clostridiales Family XIII bacterium]|jgi:DNA-binding FadR family transcriptional regulator|nr:GntR family transcriptional regulator [Clostridiales Family XIII bacterium]